MNGVIGALDFGPSGKKLLKAYYKIIKQSETSKKTSEPQ
jgi:hypothetical protein